MALLLRAAIAKLPTQTTAREAFLQALKSTEPFNRFPGVLAEVLESEGAPTS